MEFLFTLESLGLCFMEIRLGANGIGGCPCVVVQNNSTNCTFLDVRVYYFKERQHSNHQQIREDVVFFK